MQQIVGPLPIPPGVVPAGCYRSVKSLLFTFGENLSPAYAELYANRRTAEPQDLSDRAFIDAKPTRERVAQFLRGRGFRQTDAKDRMAFVDEAHRVRVDFYNASFYQQIACGFDDGDLRLLIGPLLMISYFDEMGTEEFRKDGGIAVRRSNRHDR